MQMMKAKMMEKMADSGKECPLKQLSPEALMGLKKEVM
jgi:hypothetical protein